MNQRTTERAHLEFFEKNGFLGPFTVYQPDEAKALLHEIRIKNQDRTHALFDNDVNWERHFDIPELTRHIGHPEIISRVRAILGRDFSCWRSEFFPKFPGSEGTEWHQVENFQYVSGKPQLLPTIDEDIWEVTVWTAFTEVTKENGCMKFMPGTHKQKLFDETKTPRAGRGEEYRPVTSDTSFYGYNYADFKVDENWEPDEREATAMEMEPGQCVIFTSRCMHGSYPNITKRSTRFAITARYVKTHVQVYPDQENFYGHGGFFDLSNYGAVLVSGEDHYGHNKFRKFNNLNEPFPHHP